MIDSPRAEVNAATVRRFRSAPRPFEPLDKSASAASAPRYRLALIGSHDSVAVARELSIDELAACARARSHPSQLASGASARSGWLSSRRASSRQAGQALI